MEIEKPTFTTDEIEQLRDRLTQAITTDGLRSVLAYQISRHLDELIVCQLRTGAFKEES